MVLSWHQTAKLLEFATWPPSLCSPFLIGLVSLNNCGNSWPLPLCPDPKLPEALPFSFQPTAVYYHFLWGSKVEERERHCPLWPHSVGHFQVHIPPYKSPTACESSALADLANSKWEASLCWPSESSKELEKSYSCWVYCRHQSWAWQGVITPVTHHSEGLFWALGGPPWPWALHEHHQS